MRIRLGNLLVQAGIIDFEQLARALELQRRDSGRRKLGELLVEQRWVSEAQLLAVLSKAMRIPAADLAREQPQPEALRLLSARDAERLRVLPLRIERRAGAKTLVLAMADPDDLVQVDELRFRLGLAIAPVLATATQLREAIRRYYVQRQALELTPAPTQPGAGAPSADDATWVGARPAPTGSRHEVAEIHLKGARGERRTVRLAAGGALVFGRSPEVDVPVDDMRMSRRHFQIAHLGAGVELLDLGSSNGTFRNGQPVQRARLASGDILQAGETRFQIVLLS